MTDMQAFRHGDVVYFVDRNFVTVGVFDCCYAGENRACVDFVQFADHRYIDGVPIQDFHSEQEWRKLPKGWTYDTKLFIVESIVPEWEQKRRKELSWADPEDVKAGRREGVVVLKKDVFHGEIRAEVDRNKGFRVLKQYPHWALNYGNRDRDYERVPLKELFRTYEQAAERLKQIRSNAAKESAMTDDEWSWEEIKKELAVVDGLYAEECLEFLRALPDIWDVEVRRRNGTIYWRRYEKRTEWEKIPERRRQ